MRVELGVDLEPLGQDRGGVGNGDDDLAHGTGTELVQPSHSLAVGEALPEPVVFWPRTDYFTAVFCAGGLGCGGPPTKPLRHPSFTPRPGRGDAADARRAPWRASVGPPDARTALGRLSRAGPCLPGWPATRAGSRRRRPRAARAARRTPP